MKFQIGQGILAKIPFRDGHIPSYPRPYLIVDSSDSYIQVLNISSVAGKEHKLMFSTNMRIEKYNPPFLKDSFVKLDSLVQVLLIDCTKYNIKILHNSDRLERQNFKRLLKNTANIFYNN